MIPLSKIVKKASYLSDKEILLLEKAYNFAKEHHKGQERKSGEPYFNHPIRTALILTEYLADIESICTALLHDTLEDTDASFEDIKQLCGEEIANLVAGVTKFGEEHFRGNNHLERKIETLRKLFTVMEKDIRVIIIKLCDRLDNMKTLDALSEDKQIAFSKETLNIYVKIADRLCMQRMRNELELLCTYYLDRDLYTKFLVAKKKCRANKKLRQSVINSLKEKDREKIISKIRFLPIEISDFKKGIYDKNDYFCAVTTKSTEDCYKAVFYIHSLWESIRKSFKDYINRPKINGHRALYSTVLTKSEARINFRISTRELETYYVNGITMRYFLEKNKKSKGEKSLNWIKNLEEINKKTQGHSDSYWKGLQNDILKNTILVYGNNDEGIILPENATALDAAFYIHKGKTLFLDEIFVNNKAAPLFHKLNNNDVIKCTFDKKETAKYQWFNHIETIIAKGFIQDFLHKKEKEKKIKIGKELLQNEFIKHEKGFINEVSPSEIARVLNLGKVPSLEKLYSSIGEGRITPEEAYIYFFPYEKKKKKKSSHKISVTLYKDSMLDVIALFPNTPDTRIRLSECNTKGITKLTANVYLHSDLTLKDLIKSIQRVDGVKSVEDINITEKRKANIYTGLLAFLWGLDPILAYLLLKTGIQPLPFTALRFLTVTVFLGIVILFSMKKIKKQSRFSTWRISFGFSVIFLVATAYATYYSLSNTFPSNYLLILHLSILLTVIYDSMKKNIKKLFSKNSVFNISLIILGVLLFLYFNKANITTTITLLLVPILFSAYTLSTEKYCKTENIKARQTMMIFLFHFIGAVLLSPFIFTLSMSFTFYQYILLITFFIVFCGISYLLYSAKVKEISNYILLSIFIIIGIADLIVESFFVPIHVTLLKLLYIVIIDTGIFYAIFKKTTSEKKKHGLVSQIILRR